MALYTLLEINSNTDISKIRLEGLRGRNTINQLILQGCWWEDEKENNGNVCWAVYIYNSEEITNFLHILANIKSFHESERKRLSSAFIFLLL